MASMCPTCPEYAGSSHVASLACVRCLEGHLGLAAVLAREVAEEPDSRLVERRLALGNLKAAEWHALALGREDVAAWIRDARRRFAGGDPDLVYRLLALDLPTPPPPAEAKPITETETEPAIG